jgi:hypothetical protein
VSDRHETVHVVVLMNAYEPGEKGTVWVIPGPYDPQGEQDEPLPDELERAIRIAGPVELSTCPAIVDGLRRAFTACGVTVVEHVYSDD